MPSDPKANPYVLHEADDEICAGCGDDAEFWVAGEFYCLDCASCDVCQSPYCEDPSHA